MTPTESTNVKVEMFQEENYTTLTGIVNNWLSVNTVTVLSIQTSIFPGTAANIPAYVITVIYSIPES